MSGILIGEVTSYLNRDGCDLTPAERVVLYAIAERARDDGRMAWQGGHDDWNLERIVGVKRLRDVLERLAGRGLDVRVAIRTDSAGQPVYAHRGRQGAYRLPRFSEIGADTAAPLPKEGADTAAPTERNGADKAAPSAKKGAVQSPKGAVQSPKGADTTAPYPSTTLNNPHNKNPLSHSSPKREPDDAFGEFWNAYPRKVARGTALKAWTKAVKAGADPDTVTTGARRYAAARQGQDPRYTAHPATWLNGERWLDQPEPPTRWPGVASQKPSTADQRAADAMALVAKFDAIDALNAGTQTAIGGPS